MAKKADIGSKRLIGLDPDRWVKWVTGIPEATAREIISTDFQWIGREGDVIVIAHSPRYGEFLILNELQLYYNSKMPRRMLAYVALAVEKYGKPVYPVLINILKPSENPQIPNHYESQFCGMRTYLDYRVINLWEVEADLAFQQPLTSLLPFVPILKNGGEEATVQRALQLLREDEDFSELENLLAFFATFVLESEVVQQIMRWDMAVLQQSPWYQQILQEGMDLGIQIGEQRGKLRALLSGIATGLELKFGLAENVLMSEMSAIEDSEVLERILAGLKDVKSQEELRQFYQN